MTDAISDSEFVDMVRAEVDGSSAEALAYRWRIGIGTVRRWAAGRNLPAQAIRAPLIKEAQRNAIPEADRGYGLGYNQPRGSR